MPAHPNDNSRLNTAYTKERGEFVCLMLSANGMSLETICKKYDGLPSASTIRVWLYKYPDFRLMYSEARMRQAELLIDQCIDISDDTSGDAITSPDGKLTLNGEFVARSRLKVETRKWLAAKLLPKIYGDRQIIEQTSLENAELREELAKLRAQLYDSSKRDY